jgi:hypothetical protein
MNVSALRLMCPILIIEFRIFVAWNFIKGLFSSVLLFCYVGCVNFGYHVFVVLGFSEKS